MDRFTVSAELLAEMYAHCESRYPDESCGLLMGPEDGAPAALFPCANIQNRLHEDDPAAHPRDARTAYRIDPKDLFAATRKAREAGWTLRAIFHSHADVGAYFSAEDQRQAAPYMTLSRAVFARSEGLTESQLDALIGSGVVRCTATEDEVSARMPSYPDLVYLVVDVTEGRAGGFKGFFWDAEARSYAEIPVMSKYDGEDGP